MNRPAASSAVPARLAPEHTGGVVGDGYAIAHLDDLGDDLGFRKVRRALGVEAFGVNALVRRQGYETRWHFHDQQEELYFVHKGEIEMHFGDGRSFRMGPGTFARVDAQTLRRISVIGEGETVYVCAGGKGGYVGHDGRDGTALANERL